MANPTVSELRVLGLINRQLVKVLPMNLLKKMNEIPDPHEFKELQKKVEELCELLQNIIRESLETASE
ncbi:hypothetical protein EMCG_06307 [[Emmonsia] crescens]|uniref:Uncharacterized protein n=1 Tax=[Emmonsia] crescens TaxID=73230 RepID=A0A0G2JBT1_9EURO|nr:hypothetical protein EMCG_06307 [Emmonsia crescens UAMH 3008]